MKNQTKMTFYDISCKTLIGPRPFCIRFDKVDGFIKIYDGRRYLVLSGPEKYDVIYNRIIYLLSLKSIITYIFFHYYAKMKVDSYDSLTIEKTLTFHNIIILIKSVLSKDENHYYLNIFLEKCSYQLTKK